MSTCACGQYGSTSIDIRDGDQMKTKGGVLPGSEGTFERVLS